MGTLIRPPPEKSEYVFRMEKILQTAIYGAVFLAYELHHSGGEPIRKVALKVMSKDVESRNSGQMQENAWAEIKFRNRMEGHKNILVFDISW